MFVFFYRFVQGSDKYDAYRFYHWHLVDTFVYFSHHMITIPPPCWINAAHKHGVPVLGETAVIATLVKKSLHFRNKGIIGNFKL